MERWYCFGQQSNRNSGGFEFTVHDFGPGRPRAFFPEVIEAGAVQLSPPDYAETPLIQTFVKPQYFRESSRNAPTSL